MRALAIVVLLLLVVALGEMLFPVVIVAGLVLLAYGVGKSSRWGWR